MVGKWVKGTGEGGERGTGGGGGALFISLDFTPVEKRRGRGRDRGKRKKRSKVFWVSHFPVFATEDEDAKKEKVEKDTWLRKGFSR